MNHYATRGAVLDRFFAGHEIDPDDVLSVSTFLHNRSVDIHVHVYSKIPGLEYVQDSHSSRHYYADVQREDLTIRVVYVHHEDKEGPE